MSPEEIQGLFFVECEEALAAAEAGLSQCRDGSVDSETINAVFRAVHSIKGGAGAFAFEPLQAFTHGFETLLSDVREGMLPLSDPLNALMLRALDMLSDHVSAAREGEAPPADAAILAELDAARSGNFEQDAPAPEPEPQPAAAPSLDFDVDALLAGLTPAPLPDEEVAQDASTDEPAPAAEPQTPDVADWHVQLRPRAGSLANGGEPVLLLRELARIGGRCIAVNTDAVPMIEAFDIGQTYLGWTFAVPGGVERSAIEEIFDWVGEDCELAIARAEKLEEAAIEQAPVEAAAPEAATPEAAPVMAPEATPAPAAEVAPVPVPVPASAPVAETAAPAPVQPVASAPAASGSGVGNSSANSGANSGANASIRIDLCKLDRLIDTVGELVIAQAMLAQRLGGTTATEELAVLDGLTRDLQESAMSIRAQPIGSVFSRVPRILRELEGSTGKRVRLEMSGETTELDKTVLERLGEPLTHLIRNAVDHGIEPGPDRIAAGKPVEGVLHLSAEQRSGRILINIRDDGRGIDRVKVLTKARERGLVAPDAVLTDEEVDNLIFAPGFSTAETISNISGRGVGMDVVRQNVKELGGRISITSVPGEGSTFTLALPLTLAISDGMVVTVGDQTLVVPLAPVVESLRPRAEEVAAMGSCRRMLNVRGRFIPIISLARVIGAADAEHDPCQSVLIIVETEATGQAALQVDMICDQRQFVIKSLATHYRSIEGVAGATILGNGDVALIVDVDAVAARAISERGELVAA